MTNLKNSLFLLCALIFLASCSNNGEIIFVKGGNVTIDGAEHPVKDFFISKYEITQKHYTRVMGKNPSYFVNENHPVESTTWMDAIEYCNKQSDLVGLKKCFIIEDGKVIFDNTANGYRLPTYNEWLYVSKSGHFYEDYKFSGSNSIDEVAYYGENAEGKTHPIASKKSNALGIYDLTGNVWEWVLSPEFTSLETAPADSTNLLTQMIVGGSIETNEENCVLSHYEFFGALESSPFIGFRIARNN